MKRARRALATAVAVVAAVGFGPLDAPLATAAECGGSSALGAATLREHFAGPGLGATPALEGYGGGDYPHAYVLPGGRVLWMFQDLHYSNDDNLASPPNYAAHNAGLVQDGSCFTILGGQGRDLIGDALTIDSRRWFWPLDGEINADGQLAIFMAEMHSPSGQGAGAGTGTLPVRTWMAILDPYTLEQLSFAPVEPLDDRLYGWSVVTAGDHSYLYGHCYRQWINDSVGVDGFDPSCSPHWYLARVPAGRFDAPYEYWNGSGWSSDPGSARPVHSRGHTDPMSVQHFGGQFVSVTKLDDWQGTAMTIDTAPAPQGPWTTVATVPTHDDVRCSRNCGNYGAQLLPWLDTLGRMTVALSNGGEFDLWRANGWLYRPSFFSFDVPRAADPAPLGPLAADSGFAAVDPVRLLDTRVPGGAFGRLGEGGVGRLRLDPPDGATAVALNLTTDAAAADGFVRVWPCDQAEPATSNVNPVAGQVRTNAAIVPVGGGELCVRSLFATDLVVDLNGWLTIASPAGLVPADSPRRLVDTRTSLGGFARVPAGGEFAVTVAAPGSNAVAVALNVTAVDPAANGFVTLWPCGTPRPTVSNLNPVAGVTAPNAVNVRVGSGGQVCGYSHGETDLIVDLVGEYRPGAPARYSAITPTRLTDTRLAAGARPGVELVELGQVSAVQANLTVAEPTGPGFATAYACLHGGLPPTSNANFVGGVSANAAVLPASQGVGCVYRNLSAELIVDVFGAWTSSP